MPSFDNHPSINSPRTSESLSVLADYPYIHTQIVAWRDMDAFNHINNVIYYRYAESARIAYLNHLRLFKDNITTVIAKSECTYLMPATYPDTLLIGTRTKRIGNTSLVMEYNYYSVAQQQVVAKGEAVLVRLDKESEQTVAWSQDEREHIMMYERSAGNDIS